MDLSSMIIPGAQSVVTAILGDTWTTLRSALAHRWGRGSAEETQAIEHRLDDGRRQALALAGDGPDQKARLEVFWAGYLAGLLAERPDLGEVLQELAAGSAVDTRSSTHNSNTGTVHGNLLQAGDVHGNITL